MAKERKHDGMFLAKVKVRAFTHSGKGSKRINGRYHGLARNFYTRENKHPDELFTVVGVTSIKEGITEWEGDDIGYIFCQTGSRQVYIVAKSIGHRFTVLPEDIEVVERGPTE